MYQQPYVERKSEGIAILLAALVGIAGLMGAGHMYASKIAKGLIIMFSSLILYVLTWGTFFLFFTTASLNVMNSALPPSLQSGPPTFPPIFIFLGIAYFSLWIWQIFSARADCRRHNEDVSRGYYNSPQPPGGYYPRPQIKYPQQQRSPNDWPRRG